MDVTFLTLLLLLPLFGEVGYAQPTYSRSDFPSDFVFGAGTSAYQVEGAVAEDGRSPCIWDTHTHAGLMPDMSTGDVAADGYHKYNEDVKLMVDTGLEAYRFSIAWSRLLPNGRGAVNPKGLEYYNNLIDKLVEHASQNDTSTGAFDPSYITSDPPGLRKMLEYLTETYGNPPIYIEENGYGSGEKNTLNDTNRVDYLNGYIGSTLDAIRNGSNVRGYFVWSFLDVFELLSGYQTSYGLYFVDFEDDGRKRQPKLSAHWYSNFLKGKTNEIGIQKIGLQEISHNFQ